MPTTPGDLSAGQLYAAAVSGSAVTWVATSAAQPDRQASTTAFNGGEGAWIHDRVLYFTTKGDNRVWALDLRTKTIRIHYNASAVAGAALTGVDNITGHRRSGDLFVAEDGGNMEVCVLAAQGADVVVAPFLRVAGHASSELTGPAFNPAGDRMYVSSQRGADGVNGVTWEISGPFRTVNATDALAPDAPGGVVATAAGSDVTVTWQPVCDGERGRGRQPGAEPTFRRERNGGRHEPCESHVERGPGPAQPRWSGRCVVLGGARLDHPMAREREWATRVHRYGRAERRAPLRGARSRPWQPDLRRQRTGAGHRPLS